MRTLDATDRTVEPRALLWPSLDLLGWLLVSFYLFVDTLSGMVSGGAGGAAPISQAWKGMILAVILLRSLHGRRETLLTLLLFLFLLLSGPVLRLSDSGATAIFVREAGAALKVLLPLAILLWCNEQQWSAPELLRRWATRALWISIAALFINLGFGLAGYGFTSYGTRASGAIGAIGFFPAGNEVGATYAVLSGFVLMQVWNRRRRWYWPVAALLVGGGFLIATKAAMLAACLFGLMMPVVSQRGQWGRMPARTFIALLLVLGIAGFGASRIWDVLSVAGISHRIESTYRERGWTGVLLSGRETYVDQAFRVVGTNAGPLQVIFGPGAAALASNNVNESVEMDAIDLFLWFGAPGVLHLLTFASFLLYIGINAYRSPVNLAGPGVLLVNVTVLLLSIIAGHVVFGGMAGIAWAVLNGFAIASQRERPPVPSDGRALQSVHV